MATIPLLLAWSVSYSYGQSEALSNSTPLSFIKIFPVVQRENTLSASGISIGVTVNSTLIYREDMVLLTKSSYKYAEKEKSTTLTIDTFNAISLLELSGNVTIYISYTLGRIDLPLKVIDIKYAVPETIGTSQEAIMGEYVLFSGTIPVIGTQVSIFMRPVVEYTPAFSGILTIQGPASATPTSLQWDQDSVMAQMNFSNSQPVSVFLSDPKLTLNDFRVVLEIYAIIIGVVSTPSMNLEMVNLGDYVISSSAVNLVSFEPNYYVLYTELQESYSTSASTLQQVQQSLVNLSNRLDQLSTGGGQSFLIITIGAVFLAVVSLIFGSYCAWKLRKIESNIKQQRK